jgi:hypothetical protein
MADESQLTAENFKGEEMMLDVESIIVHPDLQQRALSDDFEKKEYKSATHDVVESIQKKEDIERILVIHIPEGTTRKVEGTPVKGGYYVAEGHRRLAGFKAAGRAKIPALVRNGTWEDAIDVSTSSNIKNLSLPRKPADKRRAVETALVAHFDWSDRRLAEHCAVSGELVAKMRPSAEKYLKTFATEAPNGKPLDTKTRVGKGGKRQAATKKTAKKAKKVIDWSTYEGPYGSLVKFVDHVGEMTLTEEDRKKPGTDYQKAHQILKALGSRLKAWAAKKPKFVV